MSEEDTRYLASGIGDTSPDRDRLDLIRGILEDDAVWAQPPPGGADRLLSAITRERQEPAAKRPVHWRTWAAAFAAAAMVIVVMGSLGVFDTPEQVVTMQGTDLQPTASGEATIHDTGAGWSIRLELIGLPPAAEGQYYEGWLWSEDGDGISVGTFHLGGGDSTVTLWSGVDPDEYPSLWVTLEKEDGDPSASDQIVMRGGLTTP